jgi:(1->4)-alpha-D-glucan 1-alpha-D-glucosylmutase
MLIPSSTYRVQLNSTFTFRHLRAILPYLHSLGISTIYASPVTTAFKGSTHGYDVTNPLVLSPEIGTEDEWEQLNGELRGYGMSWIQDIVPNHMAYDTNNPWLYDVLQRGPDSLYWDWFDIITDHPVELLGERLMAPFLGNTLTDCLKKDELQLQFAKPGFVIRYFETEWPVSIRQYRWIFTIADGCPPGLLASLDELEKQLTADPLLWKRRMESWLQDVGADTGFRSFIATRIVFINQRMHLLASLLQNQHYILTYHRLSTSHMNYRRFFTVNSLICLNMEKEAVFDGWHATIRSWYEKGWIGGLRVDHIDGLADPAAYLRRLKQVFGADCYVVAEKILSQGETMPADWPLEGTTGYDLLADVDQVLTDPDGSRELLQFYQERIVDQPPFADIVYQRKYDYLCRQMGGEWDNLVHLLLSWPLLRAASQDRVRLKQALGVLMAAFPTYRGYPDAKGMSSADREMFVLAVDRARKRQPALAPELDFLAQLWEESKGAPAEVSEQRLRFLCRLMQFTGPLAAKGIEDTSFYVFNPYISHCEVGNSPAVAGIAPADFHRRMQARQATQRHSLNATTTHDTKRGEDARVRLNYLSAVPREWIAAVTQWRAVNASLIGISGGRPAPSANDEYLIYQALLGAWPEDGVITDTFRNRFAGYFTKALREAKTETNYDDPDQGYEDACQRFIGALLENESPFAETFSPFALGVIRSSSVFSLSQLVLKLTAPGVPDIYQGAELWETSLVDPDNRRPVNYALRRELLDGLLAAEAGGAAAAIGYARDNWQVGGEKLYTLYRGLACRNRLPRVFADGAYVPLATDGPLLAFLRHFEEDWVLVAVPLVRYEQSLSSPGSITLPPDAPLGWTDEFTGALLEPDGGVLHWPRGLESWPVVLATAR